MRILILHSAYLSGPASGENRVVEDEARLLREAGHEIRVLSPDRRSTQPLGALREGAGAIWSISAAKEVQELVRQERPDIVHCHNLFPALSPAVLRTVHGAGAATVMTLHNYRLSCLPATFLRNGKICEDCLGRLPWRGIIHRCYRNSAAGSASLATSLTVHRAIRTFDRVHLYLAVSDFVRTKHIEAGFPAERVRTKPNFTWSTPRRQGPGEYFLFAGRLSVEKDVKTILEAWRSLQAPLLVVGDGPDAEMLRRTAPPSVTFRNTVAPAEVHTLLSRARAMLVPSLSYEGSPRTVLEAYAAGVPVIANDIGALPELVHEGVSGLLVQPHAPAALALAVARLLEDAESVRLGEGAWEAWRHGHTPELGLRALEEAYRQALRSRASD